MPKTARQAKYPQDSWARFAPVVLVGVLILFQGGFYAGAVCVIGLGGLLAYGIALVMRHVKPRATWQSLALSCVAVLYLASSLAHGASATMLLETVTWFALAGMALWCDACTPKEKRAALEALTYVGIALSVLGIVMFAGILPLEGAVNNGRLMFTLQYANTAGVLFGVFAILCLCSRRKGARIAAVLPACALALTQSGGAIAVFALAVIALIVRWTVKEKPPASRVCAVGILCAGAAIAACVVLRERLHQATQTLIERVIQMLDGLNVLSGNALLGVGPDTWQYIYQTEQSAQYRAAEIHSSYLQIALDGGLIALAVFVAFLAYGLIALAKAHDFVALVCAGMLALHAFVDFDFQFAACTALLCLLFMPAKPKSVNREGRSQDFKHPSQADSLAKRVGASKALFAFVAACALAASAGGVYLDMRSGALEAASARGDAALARNQLEESPVFAADPKLVLSVGNALMRLGDYSGVVALTQGEEDGMLGLSRAIALVQLDRPDEALDIMGHVLEGQPYNVDLFDEARAFIQAAQPGDRFVATYNQMASYANDLAASGHAAWLEEQEHIDEL